jgi:hypothetical protein
MRRGLLVLVLLALVGVPIAWAQTEERLSVGTYLQGVNAARSAAVRVR